MRQFWDYITRALISIVCAAALIGCMQPAKQPEESVKSDLAEMQGVLAEYGAELKSKVNWVPKKIVKPGLVKIPRTATWLANPLKAGYKNLPFEIALKKVLQDRPILYTFNAELIRLPRVSFSPGDVTIKDHLETLVSQADLSYRINKGVVVLSDTITRQYSLNDIPGTQEGLVPTDSLGASNQINNSSHRNQQYFNYDAHTEIKELVVGILERTTPAEAEGDSPSTADVAKSVSFSRATNMLIVTAKPSQIEIIDKVVSDFTNRSKARAVVDMTVYEVELRNGGEQSVDINLVRQAAINTGIASTGSALLSLNQNAPSVKFTFNEGNRFDGSDLIFKMLKTKGATSVKFRRQIQVRHNQLYTHRKATITPYVEKIAIESTNTGNTSQQTPTIETKETSSGVALNIFPTITDDLFQARFVMNRAKIVDFEPINAGDGLISGRLPIQDKTDSVFYVSIADGESTLISSFETEEKNSNSARNPLFLTGGESGSESRLQTIILISVKIVK